MSTSSEELVVLEYPLEHVAQVRFNRPKAKNALNDQLLSQLSQKFKEVKDREDIRVIILTGGHEVFAAGADIKEMMTANTISVYKSYLNEYWTAVANCRKPVIAAVNGYALGGGCELAMQADIIIAGESTMFGQPEITLGVLPGGGGTQRLPRAIGKYQAMNLLLTGSLINAKEAHAMGLVSEVVSDDQTLERALKIAKKIASFAPIAVAQIKEIVLAGLDSPLNTGLALEQKAFEVLFSTKDQKEGVTAFSEKRAPKFTGE